MLMCIKKDKKKKKVLFFGTKENKTIKATTASI